MLWVGCNCFLLLFVMLNLECRVSNDYKWTQIVLRLSTTWPLQILCTVTTIRVISTQIAFHVHKNLCTLFIPLCKNNLNLPMCSSFLLPHAWLSPPLIHVVMLATSLCYPDFLCLFVFTENDFVVQPKTRYLLVNVKAGFHSSYSGDRKNITEQVHWVYV